LELALIGYFSKPHGVKGGLILKQDKDFISEDLKVIFIDIHGSRAPFFVKSAKPLNNGLILELEDVESVEKARTLVGKKIYIDESLIEEDDDFSWEGYELIDKEFGSLGIVTDVTDNGEQILLTFRFRDKEVILPMAEDFIERIDEDKKQVFFNAPAGLIEVYLSDTGTEEGED
jgi:16S rRNA processing protein RimM